MTKQLRSVAARQQKRLPVSADACRDARFSAVSAETYRILPRNPCLGTEIGQRRNPGKNLCSDPLFLEGADNSRRGAEKTAVPGNRHEITPVRIITSVVCDILRHFLRTILFFIDFRAVFHPLCRRDPLQFFNHPRRADHRVRSQKGPAKSFCHHIRMTRTDSCNRHGTTRCESFRHHFSGCLFAVLHSYPPSPPSASILLPAVFQTAPPFTAPENASAGPNFFRQISSPCSVPLQYGR